MTNDPSNKSPVIMEQNDQVARPYIAPAIFTEEECDRIILLGDALPTMKGDTAALKDSKADDAPRNSSIKWLMPGPDSAWVFQRISDAVIEVNKFFKFEFHGFKSIQIARYDVGGHYNAWHSDLGVGVNSRRKLSISVQLSASEDYDGGDLEFQVLDKSLQVARARGSTIFFPAFMTHHVTPVTRGTRWSLVTWINGPPFR